MSIFSKILGGLGDVAKVAAPIAAFIPGVGPLAAAGIGAAGGALGTLNDKNKSLGSALGQGALFGGLGYGAGKLAGSNATFGQGITNALNGLTKAGGAGGVLGALGGGGTGMGGGNGSILSTLLQNAPVLLGGAGMLNAAHQQSSADNTRNQALDLLRQDLQSRQPFRDALLKRLTGDQPAPPVFGAVDSGNPFAYR